MRGLKARRNFWMIAILLAFWESLRIPALAGVTGCPAVSLDVSPLETLDMTLSLWKDPAAAGKFNGSLYLKVQAPYSERTVTLSCKS